MKTFTQRPRLRQLSGDHYRLKRATGSTASKNEARCAVRHEIEGEPKAEYLSAHGVIAIRQLWAHHPVHRQFRIIVDTACIGASKQSRNLVKVAARAEHVDTFGYVFAFRLARGHVPHRILPIRPR